jgi:RNA polymerase sigma-B factor
LIESHLPLVRAIAKRYDGRGETLDDLVQVGAVALVRASDRFDAARGVTFATFATPAVEGEIRRHLGDRSTSVRIPRQLRRVTGQLRLRRDELRASLGRSPSVQELAEALDVDERDVERALEADRFRDSIPISESGAGDVVTEPMTGSEDRLVLARGLRALDERERRIVFLRFHADLTEREIAEAVGISQAHVSRLLAGALAKLREQLAAEQDADITEKPAISGSSDHQNRPTPTNSADTIAPVGASQKNAELAHYLSLPYRVAVRSERDGDSSWWSAAIEELPGCEVRAESPELAVERLRPAMERWLSDALSEQREIPTPRSNGSKRKATPSHSGRFLVRMPSDLHQQLALAAEQEHVSLNRFITDALTASVTQEPASSSGPSEPPPVDAPSGAMAGTRGTRALRVALATNLVMVVVAGLAALALLVLAVQRGF